MVLSSCQSHCESLSGIIIIIITNEYWVTKKLWEHVTVKEKITALSRSQTLQSSVHLNSRVFNHYLKQESDFSKWQSGGKLFHTWEVARGAASQTKPTDMVHESACRLVNVPYWMLIWSVSGKEPTFPLDVFLLQGQDFAASFRCVQSCLHFGIGVSFALRTGSLPWNSTVCVCVCVCVARRDAYRLQMPFCIRTWRTDDCAITRVCVIAAIVLPAVARCLPMTRSHAILSRLNQTLSRNCHQCHESEVGFWGLSVIMLHLANSHWRHSVFGCPWERACVCV